MSARIVGRIMSMRIVLLFAVLAIGISTVIVSTRSDDVSASHCNETYFGVSYNSDGFFDGNCADIPRFPNTGTPFVHPTDGNGDSVGYVIPRTSKDFSAGSEALAGIRVDGEGVANKTDFYNRIRYHYLTRGANAGVTNQWARDGAAFVVFTLIGKTNPPANRDVSTADWTEFSRRLNNPNLEMIYDANHALSPNSAGIYDSANHIDFFHFSDSEGKRGPSFVFKLKNNNNTTTTVGSIERKCANLLGKFTLPLANEWTINGQSYVDNMSDGTGRKQNDALGNSALTAKPGQALEWDHDLRNSSEDNMDRDIFYNIDRTGFTNGWNASKQDSGNARGTAGQLFVNLMGPGATNSRYIVKASDGGRTLCQRISWNDKAWNDTGWGSSRTACADVPFNYNLTPSVTGPNGVGTVGSPIPTVTPRVNNALAANPGQTTDSDDVEWQLKRIEVAPGGSIPKTQQDNAAAPCAHYGNTCIAKGSGTRTFPAGSTTLAALNGETIAPNTPVGTQICYTLSLRPYTQSSGANWRHSAPVCIKVSKQPKLQVWGGDVRTRGGIETGTTIATSGGTNKLFGSWVEYGGFSVGANSGFASGSGLNAGNTVTDSSDPGNAWNKLTFANVNNSGSNSYGMYTLPANLPTITDQFIGAPSGSPTSSDLGALESGTYATGDFTINASNVGQTGGAGKSIIIVSSGTVTISGNIKYQGSGGSDVFTSVEQIPQVVIIARAINIQGSVTQVDAWLLTTTAAGRINTCSDVPLAADLNSNVCKEVLTINGPVATQHLHLRRTGGSNTVATAGDPAEIFNLRPDAYMWAYGRASQSGKVQTVYSVELPPRF